MADPLADMLYRVGVAPEPARASEFEYHMPRWKRVLGASGPMIGADIVSGFANALPAIYSLVDKAPTLATVVGKKLGINDTIADPIGLPGVDEADKWIESVQNTVKEPVREYSSKLAKEHMSDNLLYGDPMQVGAAWMRTLLSAGMSAPASFALKLKAMNDGVRAANATVGKITGTLGKVLEPLTPIVISTNPTKAVAATNMAVASGIGATLEYAIGPTTTVAQAKEMVDEKAKGALDVAAKGIEEAKPVEKQLQLAGITTGNDAADAGLAVLALGSLAYWKRGAIFDAMSGIRDAAVNTGAFKHLTGFDPALPNNKTEVSLLGQIAQQNFNAKAGPREALEGMLRDERFSKREARERADKWQEYADVRTGASVNTQIQQAYRDGTLPDSKIKFTPLNAVYARRNALTPEEGLDVSRALHAQRELDTLRTSGMLNHVRFNLLDYDVRELRAFVDKVRYNPKLNYIMQDYLSITRQLGEYMREQKRFTSKEINNFIAKNPNFVPERLTDPSTRYLDPRNIGEGRGLRTFEELGDPFESLPRYLDEVVRSTRGKQAQRAWFTNAIRMHNRSNSKATGIIGHTIDSPPPKNDKYVHWRGADGASRWTRVEDAAVRHSLQNMTNPTALQLVQGMMSSATRFYERSAVGDIAAVFGNTVFAPKSAWYTATFAPIVREPGVAVGHIDKYVQDLTKGFRAKQGKPPIGVPGDYLTFGADATARMAGNVAAVIVDRLAENLRRDIITDGWKSNNINKIFGPQAAQTAADSLADYYKRTAMHAMQNMGVLGPSTSMGIDPSKAFKTPKELLNSPHAMGRLMQHAGDGGQFVSDILHAISSAPAMSLYAMNKDRLPKDKLSAAMRNMAGDPAKSGAFRKADGSAGTNFPGRVIDHSPWGNVFLQAMYKFGKAARNNPHGVAAGIFTTTAAPSISATLWNASLGPEYSDYQLNQRSPNLLGSSIYIGIPGRLPEQGIELNYIDPTIRLFKWAAEASFAAKVGLLDGSYFSPDNKDMSDAMRSYIQSGGWNSAATHRMGLRLGEGSVLSEVLEQGFMPPVATPFRLGAAAVGADARSYTDIRSPNDKKQGGFAEGTGGKSIAEFMEIPYHQRIELMLRSIGASTFGNIYNGLIDTDTRYKESDGNIAETTKKSVKHFSEYRKQGLIDNTTMYGSTPLFDSLLAISPQSEASASLVKAKLDGLKELPEALRQASIAGGVISPLLGNKKIGYTNPMDADARPRGPADLQMQQLAEMAQQVYKQLAQSELALNKVHYDQMQNIRNSVKFGPVERREMLNKEALQIIENNRKLLQDIERHEAIISDMFGRKIRFDKIDLGKIMGQQAN